MKALIDPYLGALKAIAIVLLSLGLFWFGYRTGAQGVKAKWDAETAMRVSAEKSALLDRIADNKRIFRLQEIANDNITKAHNDELDKVRAAMAGAGGLRPGKALCGGFASSAEAKSAGSSNAADPGSGVVREDLKRDIDAMTLRVEEAFAAGRAAQAFITANGMAP